jgi:hypothetical protein
MVNDENYRIAEKANERSKQKLHLAKDDDDSFFTQCDV